MSQTVDPLVQSRQAAHRESMRTSWADLVSVLSTHIGAQVVAQMAGVTPETVSRWSNPTRTSSPKPDSERRLRDAYAIYTDLLKVDSPHTIRSWFIGSNPYLGEASPAEMIGQGELSAVLAAARSFRDLG